MVQLSTMSDRRPSQLSGGQRQRVALARALVNQPKVLLLDEPLGALDLKLRQSMQVELKEIQQRVGLTFIYVTHDQEEALTMSDRLAVFSHGRVEQVGTPAEVYERPATGFVAGFVGVSNVLEARRRATSRSGRRRSRCSSWGPSQTPAVNVEDGMVREVIYLGRVTRYVVALDNGGTLVVVQQNFESSRKSCRCRAARTRLAWWPQQSVVISGRPGASRPR